MTDASVDAPQQELLGEFAPANGVRLALYRRESGIVLLRSRSSSYAADTAARVSCADGVVTGTEWDEWHRKHQPVWMPSVEDWIRETVERRGTQ